MWTHHVITRHCVPSRKSRDIRAPLDWLGRHILGRRRARTHAFRYTATAGKSPPRERRRTPSFVSALPSRTTSGKEDGRHVHLPATTHSVSPDDGPHGTLRAIPAPTTYHVTEAMYPERCFAPPKSHVTVEGIGLSIYENHLIPWLNGHPLPAVKSD